MNYFAGIDVGSTAIKVAIVDGDGQIVAVFLSGT